MSPEMAEWVGIAITGRCEVSDSLKPASPQGEVAQLVEHTAENRGVAGSIPALATAIYVSPSQ
jgi:hypothetical protein